MMSGSFENSFLKGRVAGTGRHLVVMSVPISMPDWPNVDTTVSMGCAY